MKDKLVITISREFGSGGREIGEIISAKLNIPFFDREIIIKAAEDSGLSEEYIEKEEQKVSSGLLLSLSNGGYITEECRPLSDKIYVAQANAIKGYAENGSCVIVGRCADHILKDHSDCLNVFIHAGRNFKVDRIMEKYSLDKSAAERKIKESDKRRKSHYRYYTSKEWGNIENYHLCLNSGELGIEKTAEIIIAAAEMI